MNAPVRPQLDIGTPGTPAVTPIATRQCADETFGSRLRASTQVRGGGGYPCTSSASTNPPFPIRLRVLKHARRGRPTSMRFLYVASQVLA